MWRLRTDRPSLDPRSSTANVVELIFRYVQTSLVEDMAETILQDRSQKLIVEEIIDIPAS